MEYFILWLSGFMWLIMYIIEHKCMFSEVWINKHELERLYVKEKELNIYVEIVGRNNYIPVNPNKKVIITMKGE